MPWIYAIAAGVAATASTVGGVAASEAQKNAERENRESKQRMIEENKAGFRYAVNPGTVQSTMASTQQQRPMPTLRLGQLRSQQPGNSALATAPQDRLQTPVRQNRPAVQGQVVGDYRLGPASGLGRGGR